MACKNTNVGTKQYSQEEKDDDGVRIMLMLYREIPNHRLFIDIYIHTHTQVKVKDVRSIHQEEKTQHGAV